MWFWRILRDNFTPVRGLVVVMVALFGCDTVFQLTAPAIDAAPPQCPVEPIGGPDVDDDGDLVDNGVDNCPSRSNPGQYDEDGDGAGDECDLCPTAHEDRDADCDGIGDSCDPDDTRADERQFIGFGSSAGLSISHSNGNAKVMNGAFQVRLDAQTDLHYGVANPDVDVAQDGVYEMKFNILAFSTTSSFAAFELRFGGNVQPFSTDSYFVWLSWYRTGPTLLEIGTVPGGELETVMIDPVPLGSYVLRLTVTAGSALLQLFGPDGLTATLDAPNLVPVRFTPSRFGVRTNMADVDIEYAVRTGPPL